MRFTGDNGAVTWTYPSTTYAAEKLSSGDFTIQLWVNPETLGEAKIIRLNGETCYVGMDANGKLTLVDGTTTYTFDNAVLTAGQYNHVVLTRSGTTVTAGVVTGALLSGNNFVTNGPDQISMILRDPAGSASQAYWEAGNTVTSTLTSTQSYGTETEMATHTEIGFELTTFAGVGVGAFAGAITTTRDMVTVDLNLTTEISGEDSETKSISITNNKPLNSWRPRLRPTLPPSSNSTAACAN